MIFFILIGWKECLIFKVGLGQESGISIFSGLAFAFFTFPQPMAVMGVFTKYLISFGKVFYNLQIACGLWCVFSLDFLVPELSSSPRAQGQEKRCSSSFFGNFSARPYGIVFLLSISNANNKAVRPSGASQAVTKIALIILPHGCSFVCFGRLFQNSVRASLRYVPSRHASNRSQCLARLRVAPGFRPVTLFARALYLQ